MAELEDGSNRFDFEYGFDDPLYSWNEGYPYDAEVTKVKRFKTFEEAFKYGQEIIESDLWKKEIKEWEESEAGKDGICPECGDDLEWSADFSIMQETPGGSIANWDDCLDGGSFINHCECGWGEY